MLEETATEDTGKSAFDVSVSRADSEKKDML